MRTLDTIQPTNAQIGNSYETITAPTRLGTKARNVHEYGIPDSRRSSIAKMVTLAAYAANVAHAQPTIPYRGIR